MTQSDPTTLPDFPEHESTSAEDPSEAPARSATSPEHAQLHQRVVEAIKTCYDPEIPVDIYELGLIYDIAVGEGGTVAIQMTLTSPMCPVAESLPAEVKEKIEGVEDVTAVELDLVWDPPWDPGRMSEAARLELGF